LQDGGAALSPATALARQNVKGLWIAIPTPFTADGRHIDEDVLAESVEYYVAGLSVDGVFRGGVMGEFGGCRSGSASGSTSWSFAKCPAACR
jgi:hypothetical protein